jgi:regulator of sirC expression with transglutaminase-like and TPR domain
MTHTRCILIGILLLACGLLPSIAGVLADPGHDQLHKIKTMLEQPADKLDLAKVKLTIDKMVYPATDVDKTLQTVDKMVTEITSMAGTDSPSMAKMLAIKKYLYQKGPWNSYKPYRYDFDDPTGTNLRSKLLSQYIVSKKGNCVSMPLLFIILADKMGLDVAASTAPNHIFVKFTEDETGKTYNVETTSGAGFSRDEWYQTQMHITDQAIDSGIYLQKLIKQETAAVMVLLLGEHELEQKNFETAARVFELVLNYYPKSVYAMLKAGSSYYRLLNERFVKKYSSVAEIPTKKRKQFQFYLSRNRKLFAKAESLGWREPTGVSDKQGISNKGAKTKKSAQNGVK